MRWSGVGMGEDKREGENGRESNQRPDRGGVGQPYKDLAFPLSEMGAMGGF